MRMTDKVGLDNLMMAKACGVAVLSPIFLVSADKVIQRGKSDGAVRQMGYHVKTILNPTLQALARILHNAEQNPEKENCQILSVLIRQTGTHIKTG